MLVQNKAHEVQMFAWMVSKPSALLWAEAEDRGPGGAKISVCCIQAKPGHHNKNK